MSEQATQTIRQTPGSQVVGTSLTSFDDAAESAFSRVVGDPRREMLRAAEVERMWVTGGGAVGHTMYHVELRVLGAEHAHDAPHPEGLHELEPHDAGLSCQDFTAHHDRMPGSPAKLIVEGSCTVPSGGYTLELVRHEPQGFNHTDLLLLVVATAPEGPATGAQETIRVRYEEETDVDYATVSILPNGPFGVDVEIAS